MKMECPNVKKNPFKGKKEMRTGRRAYIAWEDNNTSFASEPKNEEQSHLSLMASHHSDDEEENLRVACDMWYLDSDCSKQMTGNKDKFFVLTTRNKGYVTYGGNNCNEPTYDLEIFDSFNIPNSYSSDKIL
ncbi:hypothetical protein Lalb_Chr20g0115741 [Lupinus albus]|uniref:Uncharacterized protein n=1 Tax=Lupinus albus TaxID=3870 RepID=A0A6A4NWV6_LUPAL|nr:hypothetical protein Lalb_Chr20g0115741 [Lupinus albus]